MLHHFLGILNTVKPRYTLAFSVYNNNTYNPDHQLKAALDRNLAVAQQTQEEERQKRLVEMENAARLRILEAQEGQVRLGPFSEYDNLVIVIVIRFRTILNLHLLSL